MKQRKALAPRMDPDPWNPRKHLMSSLVELPSAPAQPWAQREGGVPEGKIIKTSIRSEILGEERKLGVYLPSGFDPAGGPYPYVVVFDGEDIKSWIPVPTILDNLIAKGKVPPMLAVLVDSQGTRMRDLGMSPRFAEFLAKELAPWLRREHRASADPAKATLSGASLGGLASAYAAFHHPDVFGNALSQSGSFWFTPGAFEVEARHQLEAGAMMREYRDAPRRPVRLWMEVGLFEGAGQILGASLLAQNRHMRDVLIAKGYDVSYREFAGGHDVACWRGSFADGLIHLAGAPR
jgi:enterochelin esterase family protein